ncbi:hypothetical protein HJC23_009895 [Cyclotella cryptica]|uniref:protein disulfide-isomerase n=1 Tax=Cyclotella cryptica TaxID=29204 RepID=A0ABD3QCB0_9STRA
MQHRIARLVPALLSTFVLAVVSVGSVHNVVSTSPSPETVTKESAEIEKAVPTDRVIEASASEAAVGGEERDSIVVIDDGENDIGDEKADEYSPIGLQTWSDEDSFLRALVGGRLALAIITAPWCDKGDQIIAKASRAAASIDDLFHSTDHEENVDYERIGSDLFDGLNLEPSSRLVKPLIGILDSTTVPKEIIDSLGAVSSYPALKWILTFPGRKDPDHSANDDDDDDDIVVWDYVSPRESSHDLFESVLMYWYRFVLSNALEGHRYATISSNPSDPAGSRPPIFSFETKDQLGGFLESHGDRVLRPAHARFRDQSENSLLTEVFNFFLGGKNKDFGGVFNSLWTSDDGAMNNQCTNSGESCTDAHATSETSQEVDPFILFVQCRSTSVGDLNLVQSQVKAKLEFDELAEEMAHRRDVAFFTVNTSQEETICTEWFPGVEVSTDGAVAVFRARRFVSYYADYHDATTTEENTHHLPYNNELTYIVKNITTNWSEAIQNPPHALYIPWANVHDETLDTSIRANIVTDPMEAKEYVLSNLVPFVVTQSTPTILFFDRHRTAQLAFPWYRKVHAVLVVDIGLSHQQWESSSTNPSHRQTFDANNFIQQAPWPSKLNRSLEAAQLLLNQRKAVQLFYNAALRHRVKYPSQDAVFLIIPSSETRILTKFGIDIWTPLDEALFPSKSTEKISETRQTDDVGYCSPASSNRGRNILPVVVLTDGTKSKRYYMCSNDIFASSRTPPHSDGSIAKFLDSFFDGTIGKPFIRSETTQPYHANNVEAQSNKNRPNVTVLTGHSFESMVMERKESHSMLLMQTITCGHCKRFSVLWNEFSSLVQAMNWGSIIEVMKIDVSKNDVPHEKIDVWDVPSVYYFPAGEKEDPIEVTWNGPKTNPQQDYDEGLSWISSGYDLVKFMIETGKLDINLLISLDESANGDIKESARKD